MLLIVGLGNPGQQYEKSRHNAGFMAIDNLASVLQLPLFNLEKKFSSEISGTQINGEKTIFVKPQTFMNNSGEAVRALSDFYKLKPEDILVIHDDKDISFGEIKMQKNRGAAGHNGVQSIIDHLGSKDFARIRIGVANEKMVKMDPADFVLAKFSKEEKIILDKEIYPAVAKKIQELF